MKPTRFAMLLSLLFVSQFLSCVQENPSIALSSGIRGMAVEQIIGGAVGVPPPSPQPLPDAILSVQPSGGGPEITRTVSDSQGRFSIDLPAGTYLLLPKAPVDQNYLQDAPSQTVVVDPQKMSLVTVTYILPVP